MSHGSPASNPKRSRLLGRAAVCALLIVALVGAGWTRNLAMQSRANIASKVPHATVASSGIQSSSLSAMPSYATALLLGGLRGPLVMILWITSENQKQRHNLQDFDTMVEWIRMLQPEFDTVHLFQIWNKAYNVSVMMSDQANKYTTILDAIDYGQRVDQERPDDINIIEEIGAIYGEKLGNSTEHPYYRRQVRKETQTRTRVSFPESPELEKKFRDDASVLGWNEQDSPISHNQHSNTESVLLESFIADALKPKFNGVDITYQSEPRRQVEGNDPSWRRLRLDPMLDTQGNIFPDLLTPRYPRPADLAPNAEWYDGSQLQFLAKYQPFHYGLSTLALAYNDYKRAQLLQLLWGEHHIQSGDTIIDSRPAVELKFWAQDEWERGRRAEFRMFSGQSEPAVGDLSDLELPTAAIPLNHHVVDPIARNIALDSYKLAARLYSDSRAEYVAHIKRYPENAQIYLVHIDDTISGQHMMLGDYNYLSAAQSSGPQRAKFIQQAEAAYIFAAERDALAILKYYVTDEVAAKVYPVDPKTHQHYNRTNIESADPNLWLPIEQAVERENEKVYLDPSGKYASYMDPHYDDSIEYVNQIKRCVLRVGQLHAAQSTDNVQR